MLHKILNIGSHHIHMFKTGQYLLFVEAFVRTNSLKAITKDESVNVLDAMATGVQTGVSLAAWKTKCWRNWLVGDVIDCHFILN